MTAHERTIAAKSQNSYSRANGRFQEFICFLRLVWRRKITCEQLIVNATNWKLLRQLQLSRSCKMFDGSWAEEMGRQTAIFLNLSH
jgi:hypothetical protein